MPLALRRSARRQTAEEAPDRMAEPVPAVSNVLDAIERCDWERLEGLLHPCIHWTTAAEEQLRGRRNVIARLANDPRRRRPGFSASA